MTTPVILVGSYELRLPLESDAAALAQTIEENRNYLRTWLPWLDDSKSEGDSLQFIRRTHEQWSLRGLLSGLIYKETLIVGAIGFHTKAHNCFSMGYWIAESASGKGICTQATGALVDWAFRFYSELNLVELKAATQNIGSRKVAENAGFKQEAILREREWLYDRYVDHAIYSISRAEWATSNKV